MRFSLLTSPSVYPVTLAQAKEQMNIDTDFTVDDTLIEGLINAATDNVEQTLGRRLVFQTHNLFLSRWPSRNYIVLPFGRTVAVTHVKYRDTAGTQTTWDSSNYIVTTDTEPGRITLGYSQIYPSTLLYPADAIEIQFTHGWYHSDSKWTPSKTYAENDLVLPFAIENGMIFECTTAGDSGEDEPAWDRTIGNTTADNTAVWTCKGPTIPKPIRQAIMIVVNNNYQHREEEVIGTITSKVETIAVGNLLSKYELYGYSELSQ